MQINRLITILAIIAITLSTRAQSLHIEGDTYHWEGGLTAGLNNDGWGIDLEIAYFPIQYLGIKGGIGFAGEIKELSDWHFGYDDDDDYYWDNEPDDYTSRFKFSTSVVLRSPRLIDWKSQGLGFYLFAEPGLVLSPGDRGSHNAKYACMNLKCGINMQIDRAIVTLGYGISDFSLYSGYPISHHGLPENDDYITHTVFIGASYKF